MEPEPETQQEAGFYLQEPSSTIDLLWGDVDLDAFWNEMPDELERHWEHRLAA
jgi:hypothetical protein